jgi:cytochrome c-type biogenesis protein CcmH
MRRLLLLLTLVALALPSLAQAAPSSTSQGDVGGGAEPHAVTAEEPAGTVPTSTAGTPVVQRRFEPEELERELMCPTCNSPLYLSQSPAADRIRAYVIQRADEGWTKQQVLDALEEDFGPAILASPKAEGLGLAAWLVPLAAVVVGLAVAIGVAIVWRRRSRPGGPGSTAGGAALEPDLEARVDEALARFD